MTCTFAAEYKHAIGMCHKQQDTSFAHRALSININPLARIVFLFRSILRPSSPLHFFVVIIYELRPSIKKKKRKNCSGAKYLRNLQFY